MSRQHNFYYQNRKDDKQILLDTKAKVGHIIAIMFPPRAHSSPNPAAVPPPAVAGLARGAPFSTSVAATREGRIGQSGSAPGRTTDTYNCDRRYLAGLRPMWLESAINLGAAWRRP